MKKKMLALLLSGMMLVTVSCTSGNPAPTIISSDPSPSPQDEKPATESTDIFPLEPITNIDRVVTPYSKDSLSEFAMPGTQYRLNFIQHDYAKIQYISANDVVKSGAGGLVSNDLWDDSYLQDDSSIKKLNVQLQKIIKAGGRVWIYDESYYPSGSAGGLVLKDNPELISIGISQKTIEGEGKKNISWKRTDDYDRIIGAYAVLEDGSRIKIAFTKDAVEWAGTDGKWTLHIFLVSKLNVHTPSMESGGFRELPNQLSAAATKKFIDVTFEFYKKNITNFSDTVDAFFMDEPSLQEIVLNGKLSENKVSWADNVETQFYKMHGYNIALHYDSLFAGDTPDDMAVRCDYRETLAYLYAANYIGQMQAWAKANGTISSGHLTFEENIMWQVPAYGNLMTAMKNMGAPGCDNLAATYRTFLNTDVTDWLSYDWFMAPFYAGSSARMAGKQDYVMVELCPTTDGQNGNYATKADAFKITNLTFKSGVNHMNSYCQLASFKQGDVSYFKEFANYTSRMSYILRKANYDSRVGIYYPIETVQGIWKVTSDNLRDFTDDQYGTKVQKSIMKLVQGYWKAGWNGTMLDADSIKIAKIEGKALVINGVAFESLVLPYAKVMNTEVLKKLLEWEKAGGKLLFVGELPNVSTDFDKHDELAALVKGRSLVSVEDAISQSIASVDDDMTLTGQNIYADRYDMGDKKMYFYINMNNTDTKISFSNPNAKGFDLYDNMTGEIISVNGTSGEYIIPANASIFVIVK